MRSLGQRTTEQPSTITHWSPTSKWLMPEPPERAVSRTVGHPPIRHTIWYNTATTGEEIHSARDTLGWRRWLCRSGVAIPAEWDGSAVDRKQPLPHGTVAVNIIGCLVIGLLSHLADTRGILNTQLRLLILIGFLGAFTTFSTFGNETPSLSQDARSGMALLNIGAHLLLGLVAVWGGQGLARVIWG